MKRKLGSICLVCSILVLLGPSLAAQKATFRYVPPSAGDQREETSSMKTSFSMHIDVGEESEDMEISTTVQEKKSEKILSMRDGAPASMLVVYEQFVREQSSPMGAEEAAQKPVIGRRYVVDRMDSTVEVRSEDGAVLGPDEELFLAGEYEKLNTDRHFGKMLDGKTAGIGDKIAVDKEIAASFFENLPTSSGGDIREFTITLREFRSVDGIEHGVFDMVLDALFDSSPVALQLNVKGEMIIAVETCRPASLSMEGPLDMIVTDDSVSLTANGKLDMRTVYQYMK